MILRHVSQKHVRGGGEVRSFLTFFVNKLSSSLLAFSFLFDKFPSVN